jgi:ABC-2 type transport system permease protein
MNPRLRTMLVQYLAVVVKEIKQTLQDKRMVALLTVAPIIQLFVFGFAIDLGVEEVPTVVVYEAPSPESRELVQRLLADGTLAQVGEVASVAEANRALEDGTAAVAVLMPSDLSRKLARGDAAAVQVLVDGSDPTRSGVAAGATTRFFGEQGLAIARGRLAAAGRPAMPAVEVRPRLLYNPEGSSAVFMIPGIAGMLLLIVTTVVTAMGLAREREMGTLEQVRVTPLPSGVMMVAKVTPYIVVGLLDVTAILVAGAWIFDVPIRGSLLAFYAITALYLLTTVGMGLLISTMAQNQQQAFLGGFVFILPAMLLSGTLTPIHAMPGWLQPLTLLNPLRFYMEAIRAILLKGTPFADLWVQALVLGLYGTLIVVIASLRFRKRLG